MPSMAAIALERLLEPKAASGGGCSASAPDLDQKSSSALLFSPSLYRESSSLPPSRSFSSVIYRIKSSHRCSAAAPSSARIEVHGHGGSDAHEEGELLLAKWEPVHHADGDEDAEEGKGGITTSRTNAKRREKVDLVGGNLREGLKSEGWTREGEEKEDGFGDDDENDFCTPQDARSVASSCSSHAGGLGNGTPLLSQTEFYDANDDFSFDGSVSLPSPSLSTKNQKELCALQLNLLEEVGRRKAAEAALVQMQNQWHQLEEALSQVGVLCPVVLNAEGQLEVDPASLCQEIVVTRVVSETVERGLAQAAAKEVAESVIDAKNHEISRLHDRLQYYEAVNREMSQRNQEVVELARQQQNRRKTKRWMWSCVALSVILGTSLLVHSHLACSNEDLHLTTCCNDPAEIFALDLN